MIFENFLTFLSKVMFFSGYINNQTSFEQPLSAEEETFHLKRVQETGDIESRNTLIRHNLRLVVHIVKKFSNAGEAEDLISVGSIGLIKAIKTYKHGMGSQLSTYASRCIENEILMLIRTSKKHKNIISLEGIIGKDKDNNEISLKEIIADTGQPCEELLEKELTSRKTYELIKKLLPRREFEIIEMRYGLGATPALTQREVANKLGISRSYISRLEKKSFETLKVHLADNLSESAEGKHKIKNNIK